MRNDLTSIMIDVFNSDGRYYRKSIEKVSKSSILTKVSILSILAKSIGNSIALEPAMFLVSIAEHFMKATD